MERIDEPAVELKKPPPAFQQVLENYRTTRDFTEACASCLMPLAPTCSNSSLLLCETCEEKWRGEKPDFLPEHRDDLTLQDKSSDEAEIPLSSSDISQSSHYSSSSVEETKSPDFAQLEKDANLKRLFQRVEEQFTSEESENLNRSLLNAEDSVPRSRIVEIVKAALKACGYVAAAVICVPIIAGVGVVITIAGTLSPPVLIAISKHRKYTSNQWWTYTRKQRFVAIGWGALLGTLLLPILAPWGIYRLFKFLSTKLFRQTVYWKRLLDSNREGLLEEGTDERDKRVVMSEEESDCDYQESSDGSSVATQVEGVSSQRNGAPVVAERGSPNRHQSTADKNLEKPPAKPRQLKPVASDNGYVDETTENEKKTKAKLDSIKEEDEQRTDADPSCLEISGVAQKTNNGQEALSIEKSDCVTKGSNCYNEKSGDLHVENVSSCQAEAPVILDGGETNIDRRQATADQEIDQPQAELSQPISPTAVSFHNGLQSSCYEDGCAEELLQSRAVLSIIKEENEQRTDLCHDCRLLERKTNNEREVLSDEESDCGRLDTQRLWVRKSISETFVSVKILNEESKERELARGLDVSLCAEHESQRKTDQLVTDMKNNLNSVSELQKEAVKMLEEWKKEQGTEDTEDANDAVSKPLAQNADEGAERSDSPQCQEIRDLPEKGPKKGKRRRKRRTGKQLVTETQESSPASEADNTPHKDGHCQETLSKQKLPQASANTKVEKEKVTELREGKTMPNKTRKAGESPRHGTPHKEESCQGTPRKQSQSLQSKTVKTHTEAAKDVTEQKSGKTGKTGKTGKVTKEISEEKVQNDNSKKTKTPRPKHAEKTPKTQKNKPEDEQTQRGARRKLACRFDATSPKKDIPEAKESPEQKSHKPAQSKTTSKAVKAVEGDKKLKQAPIFNLGLKMKNNNVFKKQGQCNTVHSAESDERDLLELYDEID